MSIDKENVLMQKDPLKYITNPLNALLLIKLFSRDITQTRGRVLDIYNEFKRKTEKLRISNEDFEGAVEGLMRLQKMYDLNPADLSRGIIEDEKLRDDLSASDLYSIAEELALSKDYNMALSYLSLAMLANEKTKDMSAIDILETVQECHNKTGNSEKVIETIDKILEIDPERNDLLDLRLTLELSELFKEEKEKPQQGRPPVSIKDGAYTAEKEFALVSKLCRGKSNRKPAELSKLFCRYVSRSFFSKIAPFKLEEINLKPYIALMYDVMSNKEIEVLKRNAKKHLSRAQVLQRDSTSKVSRDRPFRLFGDNLSVRRINFLLFRSQKSALQN